MKCKWCGRFVEAPAKAHVTPPCASAPTHIIKRKWEKERPQREKGEHTLEVIARMVSGD